MDKILLVLSGGTICTAIKNGEISLDSRASVMLTEFFESSDSPFAGKVSFERGRNFNTLSENMTVDKWNEMLSYFREIRYTLTDYKGVIIAHGTDSLAYTAAMLSLMLAGTSVPVFLVSSNHSIFLDGGIKNPDANGNDNFRTAVECICMGIRKGVYVPYRNISDGIMYLHLASRLQQCGNYSEDFFSKGALDISDLNEKNCGEIWNKICYEAADVKLPERELRDCVLKIEPYTGLNYDAFNLERFDAILHGTYHSGTACAEKTKDSPEYGANSILHLIDRCAEQGKQLYISPSQTDGDKYDTVPMIQRHNPNGYRAEFVYGMTAEMTYAKLLIACSFGFGREETRRFLDTDFVSEYIIQKT